MSKKNEMKVTRGWTPRTKSGAPCIMDCSYDQHYSEDESCTLMWTAHYRRLLRKVRELEALVKLESSKHDGRCGCEICVYEIKPAKKGRRR